MNLRLDPPPVRPLNPTTRARLRTQVMNRSIPRRTTSRHARWAVPALAVAAVSGVVAGTVVIAQQPNSPTAVGSQVPEAVMIDRGPASGAEVTAAMAHCKLPGVQRMEPRWSRKVADTARPESPVATIVLAKNTPAPAGNGVALGLVVCYPRGTSSVVGDREWSAQPTEAQGLVKINGGFAGASFGPAKPLAIEYTGLYRVRPNIAHLQSRLVWKQGATAWFEGVVDDGIAYLANSASIPRGEVPAGMQSKTEPYGVRQEFRAYDASGNPVPLQN